MYEKLVKQCTTETSGDQLHNATRSLDFCPVTAYQHISRKHPRSPTLLFQRHIEPLLLLAIRGV